MPYYGITKIVRRIYTQERIHRAACVHAEEFLAHELQLQRAIIVAKL